MFKQFVDPFSGQIREDAVWYTPSGGPVTFVTSDSWIWRDVYQPWLAAGNTPEPISTTSK